MIKYTIGDATAPIGDGIKLIVHVCNDIGAWGAGFVLALSAKWASPEDEFRKIPAKKRKLGYVQYIPVGEDKFVINMVAQHNIGPNELGVPPVRYEAVGTCLKKVVDFAKSLDDGKRKVSIHMPRIGCDRAGGSWTIMEKVIEDAVGDTEVIVYDFKTVAFTTASGSIPRSER